MTEHSQSLSQSQLDAYWMPFTGNRQFKEDPRIITAASGCTTRMIKDGRSLTACQGFGRADLDTTFLLLMLPSRSRRVDWISVPRFSLGTPVRSSLPSGLRNLCPKG